MRPRYTAPLTALALVAAVALSACSGDESVGEVPAAASATASGSSPPSGGATSPDQSEPTARPALRSTTVPRLDVEVVAGSDFPSDLSAYKLVVQCGGCVRTRREMLARIGSCRRAGVPITNYGVSIAHSLGISARALAPFPEARAALDDVAVP